MPSHEREIVLFRNKIAFWAETEECPYPGIARKSPGTRLRFGHLKSRYVVELLQLLHTLRCPAASSDRRWVPQATWSITSEPTLQRLTAADKWHLSCTFVYVGCPLMAPNSSTSASVSRSAKALRQVPA